MTLYIRGKKTSLLKAGMNYGRSVSISDGSDQRNCFSRGLSEAGYGTKV